MSEGLYKLSAWLSPAYPVGAYTYSHGLEAAIAEGQVIDAATTEAWITVCLTHGAGRNDAILLAEAWRAAQDDEGAPALDEIAALAWALAPSAERLLETEAMGGAFGEVTASSWGEGASRTHPTGCRALPYPIAVGVAAAGHGVALDQALVLYLQAFASNLISAAVRLVPLGQTEGQQVLARVMPVCLNIAREAEAATLDDIGGCAIIADIASMRHETQDVRLFRS
ncbi:MAG: urease accessory protein UreF [Pseudomonadota bacterium]